MEQLQVKLFYYKLLNLMDIQQNLLNLKKIYA